MNTITLYVPPADKAVVARAKKLLAFHEDKTLSALFVEKAKEVVQKYDERRPRRGAKRPVSQPE